MHDLTNWREEMMDFWKREARRSLELSERLLYTTSQHFRWGLMCWCWGLVATFPMLVTPRLFWFGLASLSVGGGLAFFLVWLNLRRCSAPPAGEGEPTLP